MSSLNIKGSIDTPTAVKLPGQRLRNLATKLLHANPFYMPFITCTVPSESAIKIVCISDTHNHQLKLPPSDVLIHAGDLTESGTWQEIQTQLTWLSSQPHRHKVIVAGNHDVALDEAFLDKYPRWKRGEARTLHDLDWGSVRYLQDATLELDLRTDCSSGESKHRTADKTETRRKLLIYGSPKTPRHGVSAFQYPREQDVWNNSIPHDVDIVVAHGPPRLHLDARDSYRAGCPFLAREVARVRPKLVVFGHIHASYGREEVVLDEVQRIYEDIIDEWAGWRALVWMSAIVVLNRVKSLFLGKEKMTRSERSTAFVNAAVVAGPRNELQNQPIIVELQCE